MSREQIENQTIMEMADEIRRIRESYFGQADYLFAKKLYEDGYRKQSEVACETIDTFQDVLMDEFLRLCNYNDFNKLNLLTIGETVDRLYDKCINDIIAKMKGGAE